MVHCEEEDGQVPGRGTRAALVVGNYCHDVLFRDGRVVGETLGGAASFVSNVLDVLSPSSPNSSSHRYVAKVGPDFAYAVAHPPLVAPSSPTTLFHAYFPSQSRPHGQSGYHGDRVLRRVRACDPILPADLLGDADRFDFGLAAGVAGEIPPETLARMLDLCQVVLVDVQGLIRSFDPADGTVRLVPLRDTGLARLLSRIGFLKASAEEAPFVDIEEARKWCCVIVTEGKDGCRVFWKERELHVPPFPAVQIDPTGAGDSFLGGFVAGLVWGLSVPDAALLGNFFGSLTVGQIGVPQFDQRMLQYVKQELERKTMQCDGLCGRHVTVDQKSGMHEKFHASLVEAAKFTCTASSAEFSDDQDGNCQ
ncbi:inositol 3-kinase [Cocos nucifera]|nr:inositol 3-kinase [Cocos nucifera]